MRHPPDPSPRSANAAAVPAEVLRRVRRIQITAGRLVDEMFAGQYGSTFKGRGMEFSEVREYIPGDDVRSIDWNVTARAGRPFVKKFREERELTVIFLVDASASQDFGSRGRLKSELAAEITAVLAFSALRNGDKAGLVLFTDAVERYIPPRKTQSHVLRLIREALTFRPARRGTSLTAALEYLNRVQRRRAVVFLISDFLDAGHEKALRTTRRRHDVIAVPLADPWETSFPASVRLLVEDAETGQPALVGPAGKRFLGGYARAAAERRESLRRMFRRDGVDSVFVETGTPYVESFLQFFRERARRLH